ncbi:hypothetical protein BGZ65_007226, partial [Modicella reniformis]
MATSTLQLTINDGTPPDQLSTSTNNTTTTTTTAVTHDLKRLKVYSSCLRCRAKKVRCDRKEPCSRCVKHTVECSYQEYATVQLDIRQFQKHPNNPKTRKDGTSITTSTPSSSSSSANSASIPSSSSSNTTAAISTPAPSTHSHRSSSGSSSSSGHSKSSPSQSTTSSTNSYDCPLIGKDSGAPIRVVTQKFVPTDPGRFYIVHRRKASSKASKNNHRDGHGRTEQDRIREDVRDISEHVDRVRLSDSIISTSNSSSCGSTTTTHNTASHHAVGNNLGAVAGRAVDTAMVPSEPDMEDYATNVPIWSAQAVGKHQQTAHEQDKAETF